jgi:YD repeat-containing protein
MTIKKTIAARFNVLCRCISTFALLAALALFSAKAMAVDADCIENGGLAQCTQPIASPFLHALCDEAGPFLAHEAVWCNISGGVWNPNTVSCDGGAPVTEPTVKPWALEYASRAHGTTCPMSYTDTGWGTTQAGYHCWNMPPVYSNGIELRSLRAFNFTGPVDTGTGCNTPWELTIFGRRDRELSCPLGYRARTTAAGLECYVMPPCDTCAGNPIDIGTGAKRQSEIDVAATAPGGVSLTRYYNSFGFFALTPRETVPSDYWRTTYDREVLAFSGNALVMAAVRRHDGTVRYFAPPAAGATVGKELRLNDGGATTLEKLVNASAVFTGWRYVSDTKDVELYNTAGQLLSLITRNGVSQTLRYSDGTATGANGATIAGTSTPLPAGLKIAVEDSYGRVLRFEYDAKLRLASVTDASNAKYLYGYSDRMMISMTAPTGATRSYLYGETGLTTVAPYSAYALTGIVDEHGTRYATYAYGGGRAISSEHIGGASKVVISIPTWGEFDFGSIGYAQVKDATDVSRTLTMKPINGIYKRIGLSEPCTFSPGCTWPGQYSRETSDAYDANGNMTSRTIYHGNNTGARKTCYQYDLTRNLETARIEAAPIDSSLTADCTGTFAAATLPALARKITTTWHPTYRLPATITEPITGGSKTTTNTYDANTGDLLQRDITTPEGTRTWKWTYDLLGRIKTVTDPRNKLTTYAYYLNDATQGTKRGMLASITNAAGHVSNFVSYDANGRLLSMTDANGLTTSMTYHPRGWLKSRTMSATGVSETTNYDYDALGQLTRLTQPDGSTLYYAYDDAHRMVGMSEAAINANVVNGLLRITTSNLAGNKIIYTLNPLGSRIKEDAYDPANSLARTRTRAVDNLNRLKQDIGASNPATQITEYGYDLFDNVARVTDPLGRVTDSEYDPLNRLIKVTEPVVAGQTPARGVTQYEYDPQDNLTKVTDAKGLITTYVYNSFNEMTSQTSPDTGASAFTYDAAGNMATKTDARGVIATYTYDALNRVATISYPVFGSDPAETVTYTYDTCTNGKGRLCSLSDKTGTTNFSYNILGRITAKSQVIGGLTQSLSYGYNSAGQLSSVTYPSGAVVGYGYANNRITSVTINGVTVLANADYEPFGPVGEWNWGNGTTLVPNKHIRSFDLDGRNTKIESIVGLEPSVIVYDAASRITGLQKLTATNAVNLAKSSSYGYDGLDRLTTVTPNTGNTNPARSFSYDIIGNRLSATVAATVTNYGYGTTSHRLNSLTGGTSITYTYDAAGNRSSTGTATWTYGANNRPIQAAVGATTTTYLINALGQRVKKTTAGTGTRFVYDEGGRLIGEYTDTGTRISETVWFNDLPVAVMK